MGAMIRIDFDNYFEVAEAVHLFCTLNHSGQNSTLYSILSRSTFKPGPLWTETRAEKENEIYPEITEENVEDTFERLCVFLENRD
jgi:hypothetical protein